MTDSLKLCAHCGSDKIEVDGGDESVCIRCRNCGMQSGRVYFGHEERDLDDFSKSEAEAFAAWNRRAAPEAAEPVAPDAREAVRVAVRYVLEGMGSPNIDLAVARIDGVLDMALAPPTTSQAGRDALDAAPRNFATLLPGMELVPCAIWKDAPGGKPWLYVPHADGNWVSAAQLAPFSVGIIDYWRKENAAWLDRLSTAAGSPAKQAGNALQTCARCKSRVVPGSPGACSFADCPMGTAAGRAS